MRSPKNIYLFTALGLSSGLVVSVKATTLPTAKSKDKQWQAALDSEQPQHLFSDSSYPEATWNRQHQLLHASSFLNDEEKDDEKDDAKYDEEEVAENVTVQVPANFQAPLLAIRGPVCAQTSYDPNYYLEEGLRYQERFHYDKAKANLKKALLLNPYLLVAENALRAINEKLSRIRNRLLASMHGTKKPTARSYYTLGNLYIDLGSYDKAIEAFKKAIEQNKNFLEVYNDCGFAHLQKHHYQDAIAAFTIAIEKRRQKNQKTPNPYCHRGTAYMALGDIPRAICDFKQALVIDPHFKKAQIHLAHTQVDFSRFQHHFDHAGSTIDALDKARYLSQAAHLAQQLKHASFDSRDKFIKQWKHLIRDCEQQCHWWLALEVTEQLQHAAHSQKMKEQVDWTHHKLGHIFTQLDDFEKATEAYNALEESDWRLRATLGSASVAAHQAAWSQVEKHLHTIQSTDHLNPEDLCAFKALQIQLLMHQAEDDPKKHQHNLNQAEKRAKKWLKTAQNDLEQSQALALLSTIAQAQQKFAKATLYQQAYKNIILKQKERNFKQITQAWYQLGLLHMAQQQWPAARHALSRTIHALRRMKPSNAQALRLTTDPYRAMMPVLIAQNRSWEALALLDQTHDTELRQKLLATLGNHTKAIHTSHNWLLLHAKTKPQWYTMRLCLP